MSPHGGRLVNRVEAADPRRYAHLESLELSERGRSDLELIATGVYSPLEGFMGRDDYDSVVERMRLADGTPWGLPVTLSAAGEVRGGRLLLRAGGRALGLLEVGEQYRPDRALEALRVYGTPDPAHPGVAALLAEPPVNLAGRVTLFGLERGEFPRHHHTPLQTRQIFAERGWKTIVGFQTRNPVHRAHEYLHKVALETLDGLFLNPLVGATKPDDVPAAVRMRSYEVLLEGYYPAGRVLLGVYPAAMRYAGPREALLHAVSRRNYGCTHFIVGRDHAGVGGYYGPYEAQAVFDGFSQAELGIQILRFEHTFYCRACGQVVSPRTCPHDPAQHLVFSGTAVREALRSGRGLPPEFTRPEVAAVLEEAYRRR